MLSVTGLNHFYYVRDFTDMRCKHSRVLSIIRELLHREPCDGDVFIVMSWNRRIVRMFSFDNHSYSLFKSALSKGNALNWVLTWEMVQTHKSLCFNKIIATETIRFIVTVAIVVYKGLKLVVYRMLTLYWVKVYLCSRFRIVSESFADDRQRNIFATRYGSPAIGGIVQR